MKTIIINTKSKSSRRSKKTQQSIHITKIDYQNGVCIPYTTKKEPIKESVNNKSEIKNIKFDTAVKSKPRKKGTSKLSTQNPPENITHTGNNINNTMEDFKIKHLKNNQNIKYFKNFPNSRDMIVCSILSQNFNIIKY